MKLNLEEALRYLGVPSPAPEDLRRQAEKTACSLTETIRPRYVYRVEPLRRETGGYRLEESGILLTGASAGRMLETCEQAAVLACTLGVRFDAMLRAEQARDMAAAVMLDACGSAWVEAGCDAAEQEIAKRMPGLYRTDRFSPGYGDLPLSLQRELCAALDCQRRLGVCVTESLLLNPMKSVTAVIGLSDRPQRARIRGCRYCSMRETCALRKGGQHCGT